MSDDRQQRVFEGRDKFLMTAEALDENGGVTADAALSASLHILLNVLGDIDLAVARLRDVADGLERREGIDQRGPVQ